MTKNIAVILAGGTGSRFGLDIPKQFAKFAGKTILEHTIEAFQNHELIDEICINSVFEKYNSIKAYFYSSNTGVEVIKKKINVSDKCLSYYLDCKKIMNESFIRFFKEEINIKKD